VGGRLAAAAAWAIRAVAEVASIPWVVIKRRWVVKGLCVSKMTTQCGGAEKERDIWSGAGVPTNNKTLKFTYF